jgi:hypothetical protein
LGYAAGARFPLHLILIAKGLSPIFHDNKSTETLWSV